MKKNSKALAAFLMALLIIASFPAAAFATDITGDSEVNDVTVNVIVPTDLNFALDPLGLDVDGDNQIGKTDYFFVNQTVAPVKVELNLSVELTTGAVLVDDPADLDKDNPSETSKKLYFGALGATGVSTAASITTTDTGITYGGIFGGDGAPTGVYTTVSAVAPTLAKFTPGDDSTTGAATFAFALQKADGVFTSPDAITALAANDKGVAAFQFYGELNTYADWQAGDVSVSGSYTLVPLRTTTYDGYVTDDKFIAGSMNQLVTTPAEPPAPTYSSAGFIKGAVTETTYSGAALSANKAQSGNLSIPFYFDSKAVTKIVMQGGTPYTLAASEYSAGTNTISLTPTLLSKFTVTGDKTFVITLAGDATAYTFTAHIIVN